MNRFRSAVSAIFVVLSLSDDMSLAEDLSTALTVEQTQQIHEAVDRGLRWLSSQQSADGSFGGVLFDGEKGQALTSTCYAMMAFLSRGHHPGQGRFGRQMSQAIDFILSRQRADGAFTTEKIGGPPHHHALSSLALSEIYGSTSRGQADRIGEAVQRALAYSRRTQQTQKRHPAFQGGWGSPSDPTRSQIQNTARELVFLRSARNAGFEVPPVWVDDGLDSIARCYQPGPAVPHPAVMANGGFVVKKHQGVFRLQPEEPGVPPERWGNQWNVDRTAWGMLAFQYHRHRQDVMIQRAADWLVGNPIPRQGQSNQSAFYPLCYVSSQAMAQVGGERWESYFPRVIRRLLPHQDRDGHWRLDVPALPPGVGHEKLGREYNTALAVLCLTLPDQLLPIHQR